MSASLIPEDKLVRRQLARILALMIKDGFEQARAQRDSDESTNIAEMNEGDSSK